MSLLSGRAWLKPAARTRPPVPASTPLCWPIWEPTCGQNWGWRTQFTQQGAQSPGFTTLPSTASGLQGCGTQTLPSKVLEGGGERRRGLLEPCVSVPLSSTTQQRRSAVLLGSRTGACEAGEGTRVGGRGGSLMWPVAPRFGTKGGGSERGENSSPPFSSCQPRT